MAHYFVRAICFLDGIYCRGGIERSSIAFRGHDQVIYLSGHREIMHAFIEDYGRQQIGVVSESRFDRRLASSEPHLFLLYEGECSFDVEMDDIVSDAMEGIMAQLIPLSIGLWLVKDHHLFIHSTHVICRSSNPDEETRYEYPLNIRLFDAIGEMPNTEYSVDELKMATDATMFLIENSSSPELRSKYTSAGKSKSTNFLANYARAAHLTHIARSEHVLNVRIAHLVTALECLLSRDDKDIAHKIGERAAILLGQDLESRLNIYDDVKKMYGIRSSFVHGQRVRAQEAEMERLSKCAETILRTLLACDRNAPAYPQLFVEREDEGKFGRSFLEMIFR